jgi:hypothetical protein
MKMPVLGAAEGRSVVTKDLSSTFGEGSKDGSDLGIQGDVGGGDTVDGELRAANVGKMEEAADVIVLVVGGEKTLGFGRRKLECGKRDRLTEVIGESTIQVDEFAQRHHRGAASGFGAHGDLLSGVYC